MEGKFEQELYIENMTKEVDPVGLGCKKRNMPHKLAFFFKTKSPIHQKAHLMFHFLVV